MRKTIANISRLLLALTFLFSGFVKANDPFGMSYKIDDYFVGFGLHSDSQLSLLLAVALATLEFALGVCLLSAIGRKVTSRITFLFMTVMTLLTVYIFIANPVEDCGCFGDAIVLTNGQTLLKNIVLIVLAFLFLLWHDRIPRLLTLRMRRLICALSVVAPLALSLYTMVNLPVIDFRPFKVGTDMTERVRLPEVTDAEILVARYNALGLCVQDMLTEDDVTDAIFDSEGIVRLVVAPDIDELSPADASAVSELCSSATRNGERLFFVTASDMGSVCEWLQDSEPPFTVCSADDRTLKTIIRANPGLVTLKDGVIVSKERLRGS